MLLLRDKTTGPVDGAGGKWSPRMWLNHLTKLCKSTYKSPNTPITLGFNWF